MSLDKLVMWLPFQNRSNIVLGLETPKSIIDNLYMFWNETAISGTWVVSDGTTRQKDGHYQERS